MKFLLANKGVSIFVFLSVCFVSLISTFAADPRLTYDSHAYIEASKDFDTYFNGTNADGHSYLFRPPIIPNYLHFFADKMWAAKVLNAICFVLSLWLCYFIGREFKLEPVFLSLFIVSVGTSYPWVQNHLFVWSEPLFSTLLLFLMWIIVAKYNWTWIAVICVTLYFVRRAGVIISAGVVCAFFLQREYKKSALIALTTGTAAVCWEWLISLYSSGNTMLTYNEYSPAESKLNYLDVITAWFIPRNVPITVRLLLLGVVGVFVGIRIRRRFTDLVMSPEMRFISVVLVIYVLTFVIMWRLDYNEVERYLSVVMPLAMLMSIAAVQKLCSLEEAKKYWLLFFFLWMTYPVGRTLYHLL